MEEIKIKVYGLFKINRKHFLLLYLILGLLFLSLAVFFFFFQIKVPENSGHLAKIIFDNFSLFWFIMLFWLIIEGQFYWTKFVKRQLQIIEQQKKEIQSHLIKIEQQKNELNEKNVQITDSINYASRIQRTLLPKEARFKEFLSDYFIFFKPRDIVSGDFYWVRKISEKIILVAADCTGHGVPGAFMSMLGISYLKEISDKMLRDTEDISPGILLDNLRNMIKTNLHQTNDENSTKDGMDIAVSIIDLKKNILQFSGANNPLFLIRNNELIKYKGTPNPVGIYLEEIPFRDITIELQNSDIFYMFSDGFADQFGGERNKKFGSKKFKELLLSIHKKPLSEQKKLLNVTFENWKSGYSQVDDVLVVGFSI
ncbi:MAG: SpoIIE family protein phosphatase [Chlorobi bacterium]|nr:SpoIIE family protein phosphatase [Chlorobiota bacterium]